MNCKIFYSSSKPVREQRHDLAERANNMNMVDSAKMLVWIGRCDRTTVRWRWYRQSRTNSSYYSDTLQSSTIWHAQHSLQLFYPEAINERSSNNNDSNEIHQQTKHNRQQYENKSYSQLCGISSTIMCGSKRNEFQTPLVLVRFNIFAAPTKWIISVDVLRWCGLWNFLLQP